jgi:hypothetical protein
MTLTKTRIEEELFAKIAFTKTLSARIGCPLEAMQFSCDGMTQYGSGMVCMPGNSEVGTAGNDPSGGAGKDFRMAVADGSNSGGPEGGE